MDVIHISPEGLFSYLDGTCNKKEAVEIEQHINECDICKSDYRKIHILHTSLSQNKLYEPKDSFLAMVASDLPDVYSKKRVPLAEILSLLLIVMPVCFSFVFLAYANMNVLNSTLPTLFETVFERITSFLIINENTELLSLLGMYLFIFMIFDGIVVYFMINKHDSMIDSYSE